MNFLSEIHQLVGESGLLVGDDVSARASGIWSQKPIMADAIVRPANTEGVSGVLELCHQHEQAVIPHGGLTGLVHGADTRAGDLVLSLERMNHIESIDTVGRTMTVQGGVTLQAVQEAAEEAGLFFPLDLGARGSCTIAGNLATNAGGNRVVRYGMARDQVLGLEVVLADGTVVSSMNHMIKNNAAYDLKHWFIGSEGTLGVITRAVLRLREKPASENTALVATDSLDKVVATLKHMDASLGGTLSAFEVMWSDFYSLVTCPPSLNTPPLDQGYPYYILIESLAGGGDTVDDHFSDALMKLLENGVVKDATIAQSGRERDALWAIRDDVDQTYNEGPAFTFDVSLRIVDMEAYVQEVRQRLTAFWPEHFCWVFGHLADGNLHLVVAVGDERDESRQKVEEAVYTPLQEIGGSVSAEHGIGLEKKPWLHLCRSAEEIALMRQIKAALDPKGLMNPGKVF